MSLYTSTLSYSVRRVRQFHTFDVRGPNDKAVLHEGRTAAQWVVASYQGGNLPQTVVTARRYAFFSFVANKPTFGRGFNISYRAGERATAAGSLTLYERYG